MDAALPIGLALVALLALIALLDALWRRARLRRKVGRAWGEVPRDAETGLLDRRVCLQRIAAELKRASRTGGSVWVCVVTVLEGDADRFGRLLVDTMRVPEVAFRLSEQVVCIARPGLTRAEREDLIGRIFAAAPRARLALGEQVWEGPAGGDAARVLGEASARVREVAPR